jgi:O-methyltransferase involved in polyketide biosynthesis
MRDSLRQKAIGICNDKIAKKGETVGLSFYAFFANKNDDPEPLMEAATLWIETHKLDHFVKAVTIRDMIKAGL